MNLAALLRVFTRDLYEFDLYDLFLERISRTNRGIPVFARSTSKKDDFRTQKETHINKTAKR